jgi:hypothetical protein
MSLIGDGLLANLMARGLSWAIFFFIFTKAGVPYSKEYLKNRISRFWVWLFAAAFRRASAWFARESFVVGAIEARARRARDVA